MPGRRSISPGIGWVEFEPTSNQAPLVRPLGENLPSAGQAGTETPPGNAGQSAPGQAAPTPIGETGTGSSSGLPVNWLLRLIFIGVIIVTILRIYPFGVFDAAFSKLTSKPGGDHCRCA